MTPVQNLEALSARVPNRRQRDALTSSLDQHVRNGRGFWPMVEMDGVRKVIAFRSQGGAASEQRWRLEDGEIEILDLHQIAVTDWPRVHVTVN